MHMDLRELPLRQLFSAFTLGTVLTLPVAADDSCAPTDPSATATTPIDCFVATVAHHNVITLKWRVRDAENLVYIFDQQPPAYRDPGYQRAYCVENTHGICSLQLTRTNPGLYRWTLSSESGEQVFTASAEVELSPIVPPSISGGGFVDALRPASQRFRWEATTPAADAPYWVEIREPRVASWLTQRFPASGEGAAYDIPAERFQQPGELAYAARTCFRPEGSTAKFCSPAVTVGYDVGHDHFLGIRNRHVRGNEPLVLEFTERSGDARLLSITGPPGTGALMDAQPARSGVEISADQLQPGRYVATLNSCALPEGSCSNREPAARAVQDGVFWQRQPGSYDEGAVIGTLHPGDGGEPIDVRTSLSGEIRFDGAFAIRSVEAGEPLAHRVDGYADVLHIYVGPHDEWITDRHYQLDFQPGVAASMQGPGQPLDIVFDGRGGAWMLNEFANGIEHLSADGAVTTIGAPIARAATDAARPTEGQARRVSRPFNIAWDQNLATRSAISPLAEKMTMLDGRLWFTQGGALATPADADSPNASRVILFDPDVTDAADTLDDERFCVFNLPVDAHSPRGNQQVVGITAARGRIWVAETHGITTNARSRLSSFVPRRSQCVNRLDFEDSQALASQPLRYCSQSETPEQDGCIETLPLPDEHRAIKIAHLQADPDGEMLWFTDASGQYLGRYDLSGDSGFTLLALTDTHYDEPDSIANLGGFLWDLEVTDSAVYAAEYAARHILRFDKRLQRMDEISIPYQGRRMRLHSLVIDRLRERLWFTLANECTAPSGYTHSTIGYVDLDSWENHLDNPDNGHVNGVIYKGLEDIPQCDKRPGAHQSFRGIALEQHSGRLALATMYRGQITLLTPLPGFWP